MEADMKDRNNQIEILDYERKIQEDSLRETRIKEKEAQLKYERLQGYQHSVLNRTHVPRTKAILCD